MHRLSDLGAVVTQARTGPRKRASTPSGEMISLMTVDGDLVNRCELFDEADLDAAIARFEELSPPTPRLENAASQVYERFWSYFAARDWDAMAELLADDISTDDRRRVVSAGVRHGRDADIANMRAIADIGVTNVTVTVIATRGERLALTRVRSSDRDQRPEEFHIEVLSIVEIDADESDRGGRRVRPRRLRRRLRRARCPVPRRRSGRPRAHVVGHRARLRRAQPARSPRRRRTGSTSTTGERTVRARRR